MPADSKQPLLALRVAPPPMVQRLIGVGAIGVVILVWALVTMGEAEQRFISPALLPSPAEVVKSFPSLWRDRALVQSIGATLRRVLGGFGLAVLVGVPLGILARSWRVVESPGAPLALFG